MILGQVNAFYEAVIPIQLRGRMGAIHDIEAIVDTGFSGSLTLPPQTIGALGLPWRTRGNAILADGSEDDFDIYAAAIVWDGTPRRILVEEVDMVPLEGMRLLADYDVRLRVQPGGPVQIVALDGGE